MKRQFVKDYIGWGFLLWLIGYILGIVLFMLVPKDVVGFVIMPVGTVMTLWVLFKKIHYNRLAQYIGLSCVWMALAVLLDYLFIVKMFHSSNYYKLDVYLYYLVTFMLPIFVGWKKHLMKQMK